MRDGRDVGRAFAELAAASAEPRPGHQGAAAGTQETISYMKPRLDMMHYREWLAKDLVISPGQAEGTVRQLVGERFDCAGMRWLKGKAEALLHLRCIELNGDWQKFVNWTYQQYQDQLRDQQAVQIRTDEPMLLPRAA